MPLRETIGKSENLPLSFSPEKLRRVDVESTGLKDKVILHDLSTMAGQLSFIAATRTSGALLFGDSNLWSRSAPEEVIQELLARKIFEDTFASQLMVLGDLEGVPKAELSTYATRYNLWENSVVAEFPWNMKGRFSRVLPEDKFRATTFSRNKFIVPDDVLLRLKDLKIACGGLGVGAGIVEVLVRLGAQNLCICDGGTALSKDNNRLVGGDVHTVDMNHAQLAAQTYWGINPYADITYHRKNIGFETTDQTVSLDDMIAGAEIFLEEIDNLPLKLAIRRRCRELGVKRVITGTDTGFAGSISPERYLEDRFFHGRMSGIMDGTEHEVLPDLEELLATKDQREHVRMAMEYIVGMDLVSPLFQVAQQRAGEAGARYFVQPPISARVTSALVATYILMYLQGIETKPEAMVDLYQLLQA